MRSRRRSTATPRPSTTGTARRCGRDGLTGSLRLLKENRPRPLTFAPGERVAPPLGVALFPREPPMLPRSWVERAFDVRRWTPMPSGGHFAALERPDLLAADIRAHFRPLRQASA